MKHTVIITAPPVRSGKECIPDGALAGNGDLSVVLGNFDGGLRVFAAKCDLWYAEEHDKAGGGIKPLGYVDFEIPKKLYSHYYAEQRMDKGEIFCRFACGGDFIEVKIFVCAAKNDIFFELNASDEALLKEPKFTLFNCNADKTSEESHGDMRLYTRVFDNEKLVFPCKVSAGIREFAENKYILCAATNFDSESFKDDVAEHVLAFDEEKFAREKSAHEEWWKNFYRKSSFTLSDERLELRWYASQYHMAICARNEKFPPGIYGNFITKEQMNWHGDYHLNYNYEAPFYAVCSSNHPELADCYMAPLTDFMEKGGENAKKHLDCRGIYYPVGLAPKGMYSELCDDPAKFERMFLGQKSDAAYAAVIPIFRWNATRDLAYCNEVYPFIKAVGDFWEDFLHFENGRYVIRDDAIHEIPYYAENFNPKPFLKDIHAKNPLLSLGLVRMIFKALLDMSAALGCDEDRREKWEHILDNISDYPTFRKKFKKVFRYTEEGMAWNRGNGLCIQHIYPAGQIGLGSGEEMLKISRNTFFTNDRWCDDNATNSIFPCAARIGIKPALILKKLRLNYKKFELPNLLMLHGGGCLENCCLTAATLNEMALQSHEGFLRFFPVWDKTLDCRFENLRADGAFLVSAAFEKGKICGIEITCEIGGTLRIENPYKKCVVSSQGECVFAEKVIEIPTVKGEKIKIQEA